MEGGSHSDTKKALGQRRRQEAGGAGTVSESGYNYDSAILRYSNGSGMKLSQPYKGQNRVS